MGETLSADVGQWDTGAVLEFQWLRNGSPISGAKSKDYKLVGDDFEATVTVSVTATKLNYQTITKRSSATEKVSPGELPEFTAPAITLVGQSGSKYYVVQHAPPTEWGITVEGGFYGACIVQRDGKNAEVSVSGTTYRAEFGWSDVGFTYTLRCQISKPGYGYRYAVSQPFVVPRLMTGSGEIRVTRYDAERSIKYSFPGFRSAISIPPQVSCATSWEWWVDGRVVFRDPDLIQNNPSTGIYVTGKSMYATASTICSDGVTWSSVSPPIIGQ